jgi:hypothetical protein
MAGTTGLEPATSAVTGQRSNQLSYVPGLFFHNLVICHIESSVSQLSLFRYFAIFYHFAAIDSILGLGGHHVDTRVDTKEPHQITGSSLSDEADSWRPVSSSQANRFSILDFWMWQSPGRQASLDAALMCGDRWRFMQVVFATGWSNLTLNCRAFIKHHRR